MGGLGLASSLCLIGGFSFAWSAAPFISLAKRTRHLLGGGLPRWLFACVWHSFPLVQQSACAGGLGGERHRRLQRDSPRRLWPCSDIQARGTRNAQASTMCAKRK